MTIQLDSSREEIQRVETPVAASNVHVKIMKDASYQTEDKHNSTGSVSIASKGDSVQEKKEENISSLKTIGDSPEKLPDNPKKQDNFQ